MEKSKESPSSQPCVWLGFKDAKFVLLSSGEACAWTQFLCENISVLKSAWREEYMCYVIDGLEGITSETNTFACYPPSVFILFPSRALGNNGNVFSATVINGVTSSGALSDLPGLAINLYTELRIFTLATSFLMLFWGALAIHFIRAMFLFLFLYLNDWLSKNYNIQLSSSLEINSLKMSPILLQSTRYFWQLFTCLLLIFPLNQLPIGI